MQPPDALLKRGITSLPTLGDGRQSGTSDSPSILNASPESAAGGGLAWLRTGDTIRIDLNAGTCDMLVAKDVIESRKQDGLPPVPASMTPWQEIYRNNGFAVAHRRGDGAGAEIHPHRRQTAPAQSLGKKRRGNSPPFPPPTTPQERRGSPLSVNGAGLLRRVIVNGNNCDRSMTRKTPAKPLNFSLFWCEKLAFSHYLTLSFP
ncbi:MAG: dihydroxy-acid dehydratase [Asticcacaulis sp.]